MKNFINENNICELLEKGGNPSGCCVDAIVKKALQLKGLDPSEVAVLLNCEDKNTLNDIFVAAKKVKNFIYGNRLVLFAPLYLSNRCINACLYCGFRLGTAALQDRILGAEDVQEETKALISQGHKRLILVAAEDPEVNIDYLEEVINTVYATSANGNAIRRVNVNLAPMDVKDFKRLKETGIGTFQSFQETYHKETYNKMHPSGPKSDYLQRLYACDRAQSAGIDDVGIGTLFGLYDYI